ncbi:branched-chain amino acid ABC transporter permease [Actinomadura sp. 1N219]|uniref:branched-chain amino acid ABC transporter permease n=1 Tax=Actinomadura sp. 1N219 TaxID=3375152 RepID=UPI0037AACE35
MQNFVNTLILGLTLGGIYALTAVGFTMVYGVARIVNFAHGSLYMLGAMLTWAMISAGLPYFPALAAAALLIGLGSVPVLRFSVGRVLRSGAEVGLLGTFGVALILDQTAFLIFGGAPKSVQGTFDFLIEVGPIRTTGQRLAVLVLAVVVITAVAVAVHRTNWGRQQRAVMQDPDLARVSGVDPRWVRASTFLVSGALAALAGGLIGPLFAISTTIAVAALLKAFIVTVIAGVGNINGAVLAAMGIALAEVFGSAYISTGYRDAYAYIIVLAALAVRARRPRDGRTRRRALTPEVAK